MTLGIELARDSNVPLYVQLARQLAGCIRDGRLAPGARLMSSRALAQELSVNRNTVVAAYSDLIAQGWLETVRGVGTIVTRALPDSVGDASLSAGPREPNFSIPPQPPMHQPLTESRRVWALSDAIPDTRLLPVAEISRAYRRALRQHGPSLLAYGAARGSRQLTNALAQHLSAERGLPTRPENLLITRGSQGALDLLARLLLRPGAAIAVEAMGYQPAWQAFRASGAEVVTVPIDRDGLCTDHLERLHERRPLAAIYVTPHHQYPTTVTMSAARRVSLLEFAAQARIAVIEDDYDHEFHFDGHPVPPLASQDETGQVIYVGTMSKILAPGVRIGFLRGSEALINIATRTRTYVDRQGDHVIEAAMAEMLDDGEIARHTRKMRRLYQKRRDALHALVSDAFNDLFVPHSPSGGLAMWLALRRHLDVEQWLSRAAALGIQLLGDNAFSGGRLASTHVRLAYSQYTTGEVTAALEKLRALIPASAS